MIPNINEAMYDCQNSYKPTRKATMPKDLPQLKIGRALHNARKMAAKSPRVMSEREWEAVKLLTTWKPYTQVAFMIGRGENTVLRVKKSGNYDGYKCILHSEKYLAKARKQEVARRGTVKALSWALILVGFMIIAYAYWSWSVGR